MKTMPPPKDHDDARERALRLAVDEGIARSRAIREQVDRALETMRSSVKDVLVEDLTANISARELAGKFHAVFRDAIGDVDSLFARQEQRLVSFNIVLFGRTGAGKSSTMTALIRGDGKEISPGRGDHTRKVLSRQWGGGLLRVTDTPGTQGLEAATLAKVARREVELADVVLLVFDDDSQLRGEFAEIAHHVRDLGKPAVALLNVKNKHWGAPERCHDVAEQRQLAQDVRDHVNHIRDCLSADRLHDVPVVALSAQRAVYARAVDDYRGRDVRRCLRLREREGREQLLERSNFNALEALLDELVQADPAGMRTAMLADQAVRQLEETARSARDLGARAAEVADTLESALKDLLVLAGHPSAWRPPRTEETREQYDLLLRVLRDLDQLRGGGFGVGAPSEAEAHAKRYVAAQTGPVERQARARAMTMVSSAMRAGNAVTEAAFRTKVYRSAETERVAQDVAKLLAAYLATRVDVMSATLRVELGRLEQQGIAIDGEAGRAADRLAVGFSAAEIAGPLIALGVGIALGPAGWAAIAYAAVTSAITWVLGKMARVFGRKKRQQREDEIARAASEAERQVGRGFDDVRRKLTDGLVDGAREQLVGRMAEFASAARTLRQVQAATKRATTALRIAATEVPTDVEPAQTYVRRAQTSAAERLALHGPALWLMERWLDDEAVPGRARHRPARRRPVRPPVTTGPGIDAAAATRWLKAFRAADEADGLDAAANDARQPAIAVVGNYSTGKTSFLRRLHQERGLVPPTELKVGAAPETDAVRSYPIGKLVLLDTPGYQSDRGEDDDQATDAVLRSAAVFHLFGPSLLTGDADAVDRLLGALEAEAILRKVQRTYWIINRIDEVAADPVDDPEDFLAAITAKRRELKRRLESRRALADQDIRIDPRRVLAVASDPFRSTGWRKEPASDAMRAHAAWDGMADVDMLLWRLERPLGGNGVRAAAIEHGVRRRWLQGATWSQRTRDREALAKRQEQLAAAATAEARSGEALAGSLLEEAQGIARRRLSELFAELRDPAVAERRAEQLRCWWTDERLIASLEAWHRRAEQAIDVWRIGAQSRLQAMLEDAELRAAWDRVATAPDLGSGRERKARRTMGNAGTGVAGGRDVLKSVDRKVVLDVGHKVFDHKFRPWEAKKLADKFAEASRKAGRAALVLTIVTAAWDVHRFFKGRRADADAEAELQRKFEQLLTASDTWVAEALEGTEVNPGPVTAVGAAVRRLTDLAAEHGTDAAEQDAAQARALRRAGEDRALIDGGLRLLGRPVSTVASWS